MKKMTFKENVLFIFYCGIATLVDIGLLNILANVMSKTVANGISYVVGILVAFFLCRSFVFKTKDRLSRRLFSTLLVHGIGLIVQQVLLHFLLNLEWGLNLAKVATIAENAILMYFLNRFVVFREYKNKSRAPKIGSLLQFNVDALFVNL